MPRRTYTPDDYTPETRAAMKQLLAGKSYPEGQWLSSYILEVADIIEKAVVTAQKVTEEKIRAACAAVAEAHLATDRFNVKLPD